MPLGLWPHPKVFLAGKAGRQEKRNGLFVRARCFRNDRAGFRTEKRSAGENWRALFGARRGQISPKPMACQSERVLTAAPCACAPRMPPNAPQRAARKASHLSATRKKLFAGRRQDPARAGGKAIVLTGPSSLKRPPRPAPPLRPQPRQAAAQATWTRPLR